MAKYCLEHKGIGQETRLLGVFVIHLCRLKKDAVTFILVFCPKGKRFCLFYWMRDFGMKKDWTHDVGIRLLKLICDNDGVIIGTTVKNAQGYWLFSTC